MLVTSNTLHNFLLIKTFYIQWNNYKEYGLSKKKKKHVSHVIQHNVIITAMLQVEIYYHPTYDWRVGIALKHVILWVCPSVSKNGPIYFMYKPKCYVVVPLLPCYISEVER